MRYYLITIVCGLLLSLGAVQAQQDSLVLVRGKVTTEDGTGVFTNLFVVNKRTRVGNFANPSGDFEIRIRKSDTVLIGSMGYQTQRITMRDSVYQPEYKINIVLHRLSVQLRPVQIFAPRDLKEIYKDIEQLGYNPKDYMVTGVDALNSPITALYMSLSRKERRKREAIEIINADRRRDLLKELFHKYVAYDIIDLSDNEFDDFIDFCDFTDATLQRSTQYEFIELVKVKYNLYEELTKYDDYKRD